MRFCTRLSLFSVFIAVALLTSNYAAAQQNQANNKNNKQKYMVAGGRVIPIQPGLDDVKQNNKAKP